MEKETKIPPTSSVNVWRFECIRMKFVVQEEEKNNKLKRKIHFLCCSRHLFILFFFLMYFVQIIIFSIRLLSWNWAWLMLIVPSHKWLCKRFTMRVFLLLTREKNHRNFNAYIKSNQMHGWLLISRGFFGICFVHFEADLLFSMEGGRFCYYSAL